MATRCRPAAACALEARRQPGRAAVPTPRVGTQPLSVTEAQPTFVAGIRPLRMPGGVTDRAPVRSQLPTVAAESWREEANRSGFVPDSGLGCPLPPWFGPREADSRAQADTRSTQLAAMSEFITVAFNFSSASMLRRVRWRDRAPRNRRLSVPKACSTTQPRRATRRLKCFGRTPSGCPVDARYMIPDFRPAAPVPAPHTRPRQSVCTLCSQTNTGCASSASGHQDPPTAIP